MGDSAKDNKEFSKEHNKDYRDQSAVMGGDGAQLDVMPAGELFDVSALGVSEVVTFVPASGRPDLVVSPALSEGIQQSR